MRVHARVAPHGKRREACCGRRFMAGAVPAVEMGLSGVNRGLRTGLACSSSSVLWARVRARRTSMRARSLPCSLDGDLAMGPVGMCVCVCVCVCLRLSLPSLYFWRQKREKKARGGRLLGANRNAKR